MPQPEIQSDEFFMLEALREAAHGVGQTSPNPAVGAVLVKNGELLSKGYHRKAGEPHAEIEAIRAANASELRGAVLYVTLEPCSTFGETPPCVNAIIETGFARVVIGATDPNPAHAGRGIELLREAGISVTSGVLENKCHELNKAFNKWIVTGLPLVTVKAGISLDGKITRRAEEGRWLTSEAARDEVQKLRSENDAILIGGETLRMDNPQLTVRGIADARQPWRIIVSRSGNLPQNARVFTDEHREKTLVYAGKSLGEVLEDLGKRKITSVLIEGGMRVIGEAFDARLVDEVQFYIAPILVGGNKTVVGGEGVGASRLASQILQPQYRRIDRDLCLSGKVAYPCESSGE